MKSLLLKRSRDVASYVYYRYMSFVVALASVYLFFFLKDCVLHYVRSPIFFTKKFELSGPVMF
jgi:hypothetical protein